MTRSADIERALAHAGFNTGIAARRSLGGGHGAIVELLTLGDGQCVVCKDGGPQASAMIRAEADGLQAIGATQTVLTPRVLHASSDDSGAVLLTTYIQPGAATVQSWQQFGRDLAAMHGADVGKRYGWAIDNFLGATPQPNAWNDDWVEFNRVHRLGHQLRLAGRRHLEPAEASRVAGLIDALDQHLPRHPHAALLHGDLWSGNAMAAANGRIAVIDPAISIGDGWADIAMMTLFGGFSDGCLRAYADAVGDTDDVSERLAVYQLYHVLNHVNLFGRGYVSQAMRLLDALGH